MHQQLPPSHTHTYMDSCAFDSIPLEAKASQRLLNQSQNGGVHIEIAHSVQREIDHPNTPSSVKQLARTLIYTISTNLTESQIRRRDEIRALVRGNAQVGKHEDDADHIFDLSEHGGGYFITTDSRLLGLSGEFFKRYRVTTLLPSEYESILAGAA